MLLAERLELLRAGAAGKATGAAASARAPDRTARERPDVRVASLPPGGAARTSVVRALSAGLRLRRRTTSPWTSPTRSSGLAGTPAPPVRPGPPGPAGAEPGDRHDRRAARRGTRPAAAGPAAGSSGSTKKKPDDVGDEARASAAACRRPGPARRRRAPGSAAARGRRRLQRAPGPAALALARSQAPSRLSTISSSDGRQRADLLADLDDHVDLDDRTTRNATTRSQPIRVSSFAGRRPGPQPRRSLPRAAHTVSPATAPRARSRRSSCSPRSRSTNLIGTSTTR